MLQKNWYVWILLILGVTGCKSGGTTPTWSNPLAALTPKNPLAALSPKKNTEPEKPSDLASPTPSKTGFSSVEDRAHSQANTQKNPSWEGTPYSGGTSPYPNTSSSGGARGTRYGENMAYGSPVGGPASSLGPGGSPYGTTPYGSDRTSPLGSSRSSPMAPQVGRYDPGSGYRDTPPLTASRASAASYTNRDPTSAEPAAQYGTSYPSSGSASSPNWRSWQSGAGMPPTSDPLSRPNSSDRSSSWSGSPERYPLPSDSRSSLSAPPGDRSGWASPSGAWGSSSDPGSSPSSTGARFGYSAGGYRSGNTGTSASNTPQPPSASNPYFTSPNRESWQDASSSSRNTGAWSSPYDPTRSAGASGTQTGQAPNASSTQARADLPLGGTGYRPGDTGYRPGDTGYQPGDTGYQPGDTGYNPPNTPRYQIPGATTSSSGASAGSGEYRPGSTRSYTPDSSF